MQDPAACPAKPALDRPDVSHLRRVEIDIFGTAVLVSRDRRLVIEALLDIQRSQLILRGKDGQSAGPGPAPPRPPPQPPSPRRGLNQARPGCSPDLPQPWLPGTAQGSAGTRDRGSPEPAGAPHPRGPGGTAPPRPAPGPAPLTRRSLRSGPGTAVQHPGSPQHGRPPHLLLLGVLRVHVRRAEARALERAVLVAEDAEGRHGGPAGRGRPGHNKGRRGRPRLRPARCAGAGGRRRSRAEGARRVPSVVEETRVLPKNAGN